MLLATYEGGIEAAFGDVTRDHCELGIGSAEYPHWNDAFEAFLKRDPVEGMYHGDNLVLLSGNGNSWKGESMQPARPRGLRDALGEICEKLTKWKHVV